MAGQPGRYVPSATGGWFTPIKPYCLATIPCLLAGQVPRVLSPAHRIRRRPAFGLVRSWHLGQCSEVRRGVLVLTVLGLTTVVEVRTRSASTGVTHLGYTLTSLHAVPDGDVNLVQVGEGVQLLILPHDLDLEPETLRFVLHVGHDPVDGRERRGPTDGLQIHRFVVTLE
jgi:hypothetical protein